MADNDLFLKNDSIFGRHIGIDVLDWLTLNNFMQVEVFLIAESVNC